MATHQGSESPHYDGLSLKRPSCPDSNSGFEPKRTLLDADSREEDVSSTQLCPGSVFSIALTPSGCARAMWEVQNLAGIAESAKPNAVVRYMQIRSKTFCTGNGQTWRLVLYPNFGNEGTIGVFLEVSTISTDVTAYFAIDLHLQIYPDRYTRERQFTSTSTFNYYHQNYGWKKALTTEDYKQALGKSCIIECFVRPENSAERAESSQSATRHAGMVNEGTTCYLNSLLQTLFHISAFRKAVYLLPTSDDETNTIPLCLQRVFYNLQVKCEAVSTRELLSSFGWGLEELNTQHDVQEFSCVLADTLDRKMKGTEVEGTCAKLFEGQMNNYVKCLHVNYESKREEKFLDLQLNVKGCSELQESFRKYLEVEKLVDDDLYDADHFGKQEADKGITFLRLPPVLQLQLKRFEYDPVTDAMGKVHDRFTFPASLDLTEFVHGGTEYTYELFSVLIHSGTTAAGHYFAFIRPELRDWYKFNDEIVEKVSQEYVNHCSYGGEMQTFTVDESTGVVEKKTRNEMSAYMLVYIQKAFAADIIFSIKKQDIPPHLSQRFTHEEQQREERRNFDMQKRQSMDVLTVANEMIRGWDKASISPSDSLMYAKTPFSKDPQFHFAWNLRKNMKITALRRSVAKRIGDKRCRLWVFTPGYCNWAFESISYDQKATVQSVFDAQTDGATRALYIEIECNSLLFRKIETSIPTSPVLWEFLQSASVDTDSQSVSSDSTAPLEEDEGSQLTAPLVVPKGVLVFYKWYQYEAGRSLLSVLSSVNICGEVSAERIRDDLYSQYLDEERPSEKKVTLYIEKASSPFTPKGEIVCISADDNPMLNTIRKESNYYLKSGDVIVGELVPSTIPAGYLYASAYLKQLLETVSVRFIYHDKFEHYPFKSFSKQLFESQGIVKELENVMSLTCIQREIMEFLAQYFQAFEGSITWEQVQLYKYDTKARRFDDMPIPDTRSNLQDTLGEIVNSAGCVYFDIMKHPIRDIKNGCLIHVTVTQCVYIDGDFAWTHSFCEVLRRGACVVDMKEAIFKKMKELENGKLAGKQSSMLLAVVVNLSQRAFTEELKDNTSLYELSVSTQSLMALVMVDRSIESRKVFCSVCYPDNDPAADPFIIYVTKKESIKEVIRRIIEKTKFPKPKLYLGRTNRSYSKEVDLTRGEVLEDSEDIWSATHIDGKHVIIEVPRPRIVKQALVLRDNE